MSLTPIQVSTPGAFNTTLTATTTLTGVTAGNTILVQLMHGDRTGNNSAVTISDGQGTYTADVNVAAGGVARVIIARLANASTGTHTITATAVGTASLSFGKIVAIEVPPCVLDQSNTNSNLASTTASVSATAALAGSGELALAALYFNGLSAGGGTFPPTGGTGTYTESVPASSSEQCEAAYQVLTSASGVGANWGTFTQSSKWSAAVAVYRATAIVPIAPMALGGMVVQVCQ